MLIELTVQKPTTEPPELNLSNLAITRKISQKPTTFEVRNRIVIYVKNWVQGT